MIVLALLSAEYTTQAQAIFTYGTRQVSKKEFTRAYLKNNDTSISNKASDVKKYLDLYTRFKLKVQAAYDMKLDTLLKQQEEVMSFRQQIEEPFMRDNAMMQKLIREAEVRGQKDIRVSHIFIPYRTEFVSNPNQVPAATIKDSAEAKRKILEAYEKLKKGDDFGVIAESYSQDPSVRSNKGDLGFITVFNLPYTLETVAYGLPLNSVSQPVQTDAGWHILKKTAERPAVGLIRARQILIAVDRQGTQAEKKAASVLADSLYRAIQSGSSFEELAKIFSFDASAALGGQMPVIGIGEYDPIFERNVFGLKKDGDVTAPFETSMGFHIVKRDAVLKYDNNNPVAEYTWDYAVQNDKRGQLPVKSFQKTCIVKTGMKKKPVDEKELFRYTDSVIANGKPTYSAVIKENTVLVEFPGEKVTVSKWLDYVVRRSPDRSIVTYKKFYGDFYNDMCMAYYRKNLEKFDPEFKAQYTEFMEGNLLFEIMERKVWNKSASDTVALKKHYETNKAKYTWGNSAEVIVLTAPDKGMAEMARKSFVVQPSNWRNLSELFDGKLLTDSSRMEWSQIPYSSDQFANGFTTPLINNKEDQSYSFYHIVKIFPHPSQKSFEDAKGQIINDYQYALEEKWVAELKKKYPVKVNPLVVDQAIKELIAK